MPTLGKPAGCSGCVMEHKGKGFCPDAIVPGAAYTIYGEAPGTTEIKDGLPFQGKAGWVLKQWLLHNVPLLKIASEQNKISYKNILKCLPPEKAGRAYPSGAEREAAEAHCKQYRDDTTDAPVVILCGEVPQRHFFGEELAAEDASDRQLKHDLKGVTGRVGRVYLRDGKRWVFNLHPAYVLRQPAMVQAAQAALQIAAETDRELEPAYLPWEQSMGELL